eukprot:g10109.t1
MADNLPSDLRNAIQEAIIAAELARVAENTPGMGIGIVYDQSTLWAGGLGLCDKNDPSSRVNADSIFRIGSISKVFSVMELLRLQENGMLHLDTEVKQLQPLFSVKSAYPASSRGISLEQLATHLSGLPADTVCGSKDSNPDCELSSEEAFARIADLHATLPPNTWPLYSNLGFSILGNVLADWQGLSFSDMMNKHILGPMALKSTGTNMSQAPMSRLAKPYLPDSQGKIVACPAKVCLRTNGWDIPAGSFYSSVNDLNTLMKLFFNDQAAIGSAPGQILDGATIRDSLRIRYLNSDGMTGFALPWELYKFDDYMLRTKRGDVEGYASELIMVQELKLGFVVLANVMEHAQAAAQAMARVLVPAFRNSFAAMANNPSPPPPPVPPSPSKRAIDLALYVGTYVSSGAGTINITFPVAGVSMLSLSTQYTTTALYYMNFPSLNQHTFMTVPAPGDLNACLVYQLEWDQYYDYVYFHADSSGSKILSLTMDVYYGYVFNKAAVTQTTSSLD